MGMELAQSMKIIIAMRMKGKTPVVAAGVKAEEKESRRRPDDSKSK